MTARGCTSWSRRPGALLGGMLLLLGLHGPAAAEEAVSLCAEVKLEIRQELTMERQAFDARMVIGNGLPQLPIEDVHIELVFTDDFGQTVIATSDTLHTNAQFFVTVDSLDGITGVSGSGQVEPQSTAEIHWLIIPAPGAAGDHPQGRRYDVGATATYSIGGEEEVLEVLPDSIYVRPTAILELDYFLPESVYADDAFTEIIEPPVPFPLGVRVRNKGYGTAAALKIDSGQPKIIENELGLLINFTITGTEVDGTVVEKSMLVDFGDVEGGRAAVARWIMETTLSGEFTEFTASFSHADELGGELTSLIEGVYAHIMIHDVLVDAPGRDAIRDFLAWDDVNLVAYESDNLDTPVTDRSALSTLNLVGSSGLEKTYTVTLPETVGALYTGISIPDSDYMQIVSVVRDDGKRLPAANAWFSKVRETGIDPWEHALNLFDVDGGGVYTVVIEDIGSVPMAPVLGYIGDQVVHIGDPLGVGFLVETTDANGTVPSLASTTLPPGSTFGISTNGLITQGTFFWLPTVGQEGIYPIRFTASDGVLTDDERIRIYVGKEGEPLSTNGIPISLDGYSVVITNLTATSQDATATLAWQAIAGMDYDVYYSDELFADDMPWLQIATNLMPASSSGSYEDATLGINRMRRFYQVVLGGDSPVLQGAWGVMRRDLDARAYAFVAPPLRLDGALDGELGRILGETLAGDNRGPGDGLGDELFLMNADGSWRTLYLDSSARWMEEHAQPTTVQLEPGRGLIVLRNQAAPARLTFTGAVGNDGTRTLAIRTGWNLLNLSEGRDLSLNELFAQASPGPHGAAAEQDADQIIVWDENGQGSWLMYATGWGAPYDGHWIDLATLTITDLTLKPGRPLYYYRQPAAGSLNLDY